MERSRFQALVDSHEVGRQGDGDRDDDGLLLIAPLSEEGSGGQALISKQSSPCSAQDGHLDVAMSAPDPVGLEILPIYCEDLVST